MRPDWLGSPQHFVAGVLLALAVGALGYRMRLGPPWLVATIAVMATVTAETLVELFEYPVLHPERHMTNPYFDTIADLANTLAGALIGGAIVLAWPRFSRRRL
ncbi:hypothetical protein [Capillimicrobium parvum]|uniref:Uncharacterized protein n=1 Tax=Capillimicrobium parvum TaxID=2884022 RepID=A0A9E6XXB6_9ACTN|nr:hypothetical protein [Capillimicrobium parvum]UGS35511.1 hypothetical protein DSM104329_01904 [Capillimicrobium parvum]